MKSPVEEIDFRRQRAPLHSHISTAFILSRLADTNKVIGGDSNDFYLDSTFGTDGPGPT